MFRSVTWNGQLAIKCCAKLYPLNIFIVNPGNDYHPPNDRHDRVLQLLLLLVQTTLQQSHNCVHNNRFNEFQGTFKPPSLLAINLHKWTIFLFLLQLAWAKRFNFTLYPIIDH